MGDPAIDLMDPAKWHTVFIFRGSVPQKPPKSLSPRSRDNISQYVVAGGLTGRDKMRGGPKKPVFQEVSLRWTYCNIFNALVSPVRRGGLEDSRAISSGVLSSGVLCQFGVAWRDMI